MYIIQELDRTHFWLIVKMNSDTYKKEMMIHIPIFPFQSRIALENHKCNISAVTWAAAATKWYNLYL
jgi:hypothetical protein